MNRLIIIIAIAFSACEVLDQEPGECDCRE